MFRNWFVGRVGFSAVPLGAPGTRALAAEVCFSWSIHESSLVLRDVHRPICAVLVEDKANGPAVVQRLKVNVPGVIEINPQGGKVARMFAAAPEWQAGDWYVDRNAAWTEPLIEQVTMFPNAAHDDMADAMSQAAAWLLQHRGHGWRVTDAFSGRVIYDCT